MKPIQILLVDDEPLLVETLAERLEIRGISAEWVTTGEAGCNILNHHKFDVAILDINLPGMNGFDLKTQMVRIAPEMKFIFITGHNACSMEHDNPGEKKIITGSTACLTKPVDITVLVEKIREITGAEE